jgi:hypothetical protein
LELFLLTFVKSLQQSDLGMFIDALTQLALWFSSFHHHSYARWASVHLRDMILLDRLHPNIIQKFKLGKFTVNTTGRPFAAKGLDLAH